MGAVLKGPALLPDLKEVSERVWNFIFRPTFLARDLLVLLMPMAFKKFETSVASVSFHLPLKWAIGLEEALEELDIVMMLKTYVLLCSNIL